MEELKAFTKNNEAHVWLEEIVGEEMNLKQRWGKKMRQKNYQFNFFCLVGYRTHVSPLISFPSPHFLSSLLLIFFQTKHAKSLWDNIVLVPNFIELIFWPGRFATFA